ncbi:MAG: hypothetical protein ACHQNV_03010 [Vicinamibacteria bacterium]
MAFDAGRGLVAVLAFLGREGLLLTSVALLLLVLSGRLGSSLGLSDLFWRATLEPGAHPARLVIGWTVGVLLGADALIGLIVESAPGGWTCGWRRGSFLDGLRSACVVAGIIVTVIWLMRPRSSKHEQKPRSEDLLPTSLLPCGAALGLATVVVLVDELPSLTPAWLLALLDRGVPRLPQGELREFHLTAGVLALAGVALYLALRFLNRRAGWQIYPAGAVCVLLYVISAAHGFVAYRWAAAQVPTYLALAATYALLNARFQRARVVGLEGVQPGAVELLDDLAVLEKWRRRHEKPPVLVIMAADGGGIRAGLWTATVLARLEQEWPPFALHLRAVTGASGGMLGAAIWVATLAEPEDARRPRHRCGGSEVGGDEVLDMVQMGGLSAIAAGMVFRDFLPPPFRSGPDRGRCLELAWEGHCAELRRPMADLAPGEGSGWRPSLILSPMIVEDGRRLVISNLDLGSLLDNEGPMLGGGRSYSLAGVQLFRKLPARTLSLSTAVRLQANFPWVLPSTELPPLDPGRPRFRVVDAGYYDETGVDLACLWIFRHREWLRAHTAGVLLIQNRDQPSRNRHELPRAQRGLVRGLDGLVTPVSAVLRARDSTASYRNDATVAALARTFNQGTDDEFFTTAVFELTSQASLSWSLTPPEAEAIRGDIGRERNVNVLNALTTWLSRHGAV